MKLSMKDLSETFEEVRALVMLLGNGQVSFDGNPIDIKTSPHTRLTTIKCIRVHEKGEITLFNGKDENRLEETDQTDVY